MKEFKVWLRYTKYAFEIALTHKSLALVFLVAKSLRIVLFVLFLGFLLRGARGIGDYSREQIIFFYLTFNLIDSMSQMLFREVYRFLNLIVTGGLDLVLIKPVNPLIRALLGGADVLDLIELLFIVPFTVWFGLRYITGDIRNWLLYLVLVGNGLLLAAAFHVFVLGIGVISIKIDHLILIYRDFSAMLRLPVDLYTEPIRFFLTFIIPLGVMITFPAKAFFGVLSPEMVLLSIVLSVSALYVSIRFWKSSLRYYQGRGS